MTSLPRQPANWPVSAAHLQSVSFLRPSRHPAEQRSGLRFPYHLSEVRSSSVSTPVRLCVSWHRDRSVYSIPGDGCKGYPAGACWPPTAVAPTLHSPASTTSDPDHQRSILPRYPYLSTDILSDLGDIEAPFGRAAYSGSSAVSGSWITIPSRARIVRGKMARARLLTSSSSVSDRSGA